MEDGVVLFRPDIFRLALKQQSACRPQQMDILTTWMDRSFCTSHERSKPCGVTKQVIIWRGSILRCVANSEREHRLQSTMHGQIRSSHHVIWYFLHLAASHKKTQTTQVINIIRSSGHHQFEQEVINNKYASVYTNGCVKKLPFGNEFLLHEGVQRHSAHYSIR